MRPVSMARNECCNFSTDGSCDGVNIQDDLRLTLMSTAGKPCLLSKEKRCRYFEECVLAMVDWTRDLKKRVEFEEAVDIYQDTIRKEKENDNTDRKDMERTGNSGITEHHQNSTHLSPTGKGFSMRLSRTKNQNILRR